MGSHQRPWLAVPCFPAPADGALVHLHCFILNYGFCSHSVATLALKSSLSCDRISTSCQASSWPNSIYIA